MAHLVPAWRHAEWAVDDASERQLAAATARVGIRTAELFPEVSVSGFIRLIGADGVDLGSAASQAWGVAPTAS